MTLSYRASGLLAHLHATTTPGQPVDTAGLARPEHREGRDAIRAMLRELAAAGHVTIDRRQDARGHWSTTTTLLPASGNPLVAPETAQPAPVKPSPQVRPETDSPAPVNPPRAHAHAVLPTPVGSGSTTSSEITTKPLAAAAATRTSAHARLAELNDTAVQRPDAYALVSTWARDLATPIRTETQRQLAKTVDTLLADLGPRADLAILRTALNDWATRGRTPGFITHCYDDAARAARAALNSQDVPGSRVHQPAGRSARGDKVRGWLSVDEDYQAQASENQFAAFAPRVIEGGRSA